MQKWFTFSLSDIQSSPFFFGPEHSGLILGFLLNFSWHWIRCKGSLCFRAIWPWFFFRATSIGFLDSLSWFLTSFLLSAAVDFLLVDISSELLESLLTDSCVIRLFDGSYLCTNVFRGEKFKVSFAESLLLGSLSSSLVQR